VYRTPAHELADARIRAMLDAIRDFIEWASADIINVLATVFPYLVVGLVGLYVLWLIVGYLRVSQVGLREAHSAQPAVALAAPDGEALPAAPRGLPYCATDGLQFPIGARFCTRCERDLTIDCVTCGATVSASEASCYRCGTSTGVAEPALLG
jgi:hypothetical protein